MTRIAFALAAAMFFAGPLTASAGAQARNRALNAPATARPLVGRMAAANDSTTRSGTNRTRVMAALVTRGAPRSVQLVAVPVPTLLPRDRNIRFTVTPTGGATILGRRSGTVNLRADPDAAVLVTVGVQSTALAGRSTVAEVTFSLAGFEPVMVPVDLEVTPRRGVALMTATQLIVARPGARAKIDFRLTNLGNAIDTVTVRVDGPPGWRARLDNGGTYVLPIHSITEASATVQVPNEAEGTVALRIIAAGNGSERARTTASVEVPYNDSRRRGRLRATPSMSTTLEDARLENLGAALLLNGPIYRGVGFEGRWSRSPQFGTPGLSRVGSVSGRPHAAFYAENWRLDLGDAGANLSELAGVNAYGRGAALSIRSGAWSGNSLVARQSSFTQSGSGRPLMFGAAVQRRLPAFELFSNITHLENGQRYGGRLDALTIGAQSSAVSDNRLRGEIAYRQFDAGQGIGVAGEADRRNADGELRVRASHAPGGADAFARARNQLSGYGSRAMSPWFRASGGVWYSDDASSRTERKQSTARTHVTTTMTLPRGVTIGATAEATSLSFRDSSGAQFGGSSKGAGMFGSGRIARVMLSGSSMISSDRRSSPLDSIGGAQEAEQRLVWRGQAALSLRYGVITGGVWSQRPLQSSTFMPAQTEMQLAMQDIRIPLVDRYATFGASVSRLSGLGLMAPVVTQRYDARARLPGDIRLGFDVERNPLFLTRRQWSTALRIERDFELPTAATVGRGGLVFQDLNGNGVRDRGEPGLGGIIVRADGEMAVTSADGRYRLAAVDRVPPQVDERSLPYGWLLSVRQGSRRQDFAVVPMSSVEVRLQVSPDASDRASRQSLAAVGVMARDSADRVWIARVDSAGLAVFDALPPGTYRIVLDLSRLAEPLLTRAPLPTFRTLPNRETLRLMVPVHPRPVRVWRPGGAVATDSLVTRPPAIAPRAAAPVVMPVRTDVPPETSPVASAAIDRVAPLSPGISVAGASGRLIATRPVVEVNTRWMEEATEFLLRASVARHPQVIPHRVRRGEYLRAIATHYLGDERHWRDHIWEFNSGTLSDPDLIQEGQIVHVYVPRDGAVALRPRPAAPVP